MNMHRSFYRATLRIIKHYPNKRMQQFHHQVIKQEYRYKSGDLQQAYIGYLVALESLKLQRRYFKYHHLPLDPLPPHLED